MNDSKLSRSDPTCRCTPVESRSFIRGESQLADFEELEEDVAIDAQGNAHGALPMRRTKNMKKRQTSAVDVGAATAASESAQQDNQSMRNEMQHTTRLALDNDSMFALVACSGGV